MPYVFISYSKQNSDYAAKLVKRLKQKGFNVWIDHHNLRPGYDWWKSICKALRAADAFIVIMTPESEQSAWVQREVHLADKWGVPAYPVLLSGEEEFSIYTNIQFEDVRTESSRNKFPSRDFYTELRKSVPLGNGTDISKHPIVLPDDIRHEIDVDIEAYPFVNGDDGIEIGVGGAGTGSTLTEVEKRKLPVKTILSIVAILVLFVVFIFTSNSFTTHSFCNTRTQTTSEVIVRLANGANIYNSYLEDVQSVNTIVYPDSIDVPRTLVAHARHNEDDELWFMVDHPTRTGYYGWVNGFEVRYHPLEHTCLPTHNTNRFPRDTHPVFDAPSPEA